MMAGKKTTSPGATKSSGESFQNRSMIRPEKKSFSKTAIRYIAAFLILIFVAIIYNFAVRIISSAPTSRTYVLIGYGILLPLVMLVVLAVILISPGDYLANRISNFVYATKIKPSIRFHSRAEAALAKGFPVEAIKEYQAILEKDPGDIDAQLKIAHIYCYKLKKYEEAIREYHKVFAKEPGRILGTFVLHEIVYICAYRLHNPKLAIIELQEIIDNFPDTMYAYRAKDYLEELPEQPG
jgi:tetratricopeptide (TPR) repeat protein